MSMRLLGVILSEKLLRYGVNLIAVVLLGISGFLIVPTLSRRFHRSLVIHPSKGDLATLLVIFQPADCSSYLSFIADWRRVRSDSITVIGVPLNVSDSTELASLSATFPARFPLRPELAPSALALATRFGHRVTPMALVLDANGNPRMLIGPEAGSSPQLDVESLVVGYRHTVLRRAR
jgi:hypothetical protein